MWAAVQGEHALTAAALGLAATGIDIVDAAISAAEAKARSRRLTAKFLVHDAPRLAAMGEQFDTVLDCALFHVFSGADRLVFADGLHAILREGGRYLMLCIKARSAGTRDVRRMSHPVSELEIRETFAGGWRINSIKGSVLQTRRQPAGIMAWLADITRV